MAEERPLSGSFSRAQNASLGANFGLNLRRLSVSFFGEAPALREIFIGGYMPPPPPGAAAGDEPLPPAPPPSFAPNIFVSAKYRPLTFPFVCLAAQFERVANIYFLLISVLMLVGTYFPAFFVSPLTPFSTLGPLCLVLLLTMAKEWVEDSARHRADAEMNARPTRIVRLGSGAGAGASARHEVEVRPWRDVQVGDVVEIHDREMLPADVVVLATAEADGTCRVETSNIDGETNLKLRRVELGLRHILRDDERLSSVRASGRLGSRLGVSGVPGPTNGQLRRMAAMRGRLACDAPNPSIYTFAGTLHLEGCGVSQRAVLGSGPAEGGGEAAAAARAQPSTAVGISANGVALHGSMLRSTAWMLGLVIYTGRETKLAQKGGQRANKMSRLERITNRCIYFIFGAQCLMCFVSAVCVMVWDAANDGAVPYLTGPSTTSVSGNISEILPAPVAYWLQFFVLYCNFIPISLYVTIEMCNLAHASVINNDVAMFDALTNTPACARSTNKATDLGEVGVVLSDKTGTLTCNIMTLTKCSIGGCCFRVRSEEQGGLLLEGENNRTTSSAGKETKVAVASAVTTEVVDVDGATPPRPAARKQRGRSPARSVDGKELAPELRQDVLLRLLHGDAAALASEGSDSSMMAGLSAAECGAMAPQCRLFFECMSLCHTVVAEAEAVPTGGPKFIYEAESPDEAALVDAASALGVEFAGRLGECDCVEWVASPGKAPVKRVYEVLAVNAFTSDRKRMSVLLRETSLGPHSDGSGPPLGDAPYVLLCKGADSHVLPHALPLPAAEQASLEADLTAFSRDGLRTLVLARRELSEVAARQWLDGFFAAQCATEGREERLNAAAVAIERDLTVLGATAVEDQLQEDVPETIRDLRAAGIRLWMLTGDKEETAVNIGYSTALLTGAAGGQRQQIIKLSAADGRAGIEQQLDEALRVMGTAHPLPRSNSPDSINGDAGTVCWSTDQRAPLLSDPPDAVLSVGFSQALSSEPRAMVVDGDALELILNERPKRSPSASAEGQCFSAALQESCVRKAADEITPLARKWVKVAERCSTVIACRVVPQQKAAVVHVVRSCMEGAPMTLAIGDGANDVGMIEMAAVGVGISGREGLQAANASDYSIAQFRFLKRLLLVHGHWSYTRMCKVVLYSFYKVLFAAALQVLLHCEASSTDHSCRLHIPLLCVPASRTSCLRSACSTSRFTRPSVARPFLIPLCTLASTSSSACPLSVSACSTATTPSRD